MTARVLARITPSQPWGAGYAPVDHSLQAMFVAANELLDAALQVQNVTEALQLVQSVKEIRERLDAVTTVAFQKANSF